MCLSYNTVLTFVGEVHDHRSCMTQHKTWLWDWPDSQVQVGASMNIVDHECKGDVATEGSRLTYRQTLSL